MLILECGRGNFRESGDRGIEYDRRWPLWCTRQTVPRNRNGVALRYRAEQRTMISIGLCLRNLSGPAMTWHEGVTSARTNRFDSPNGYSEQFRRDEPHRKITEAFVESSFRPLRPLCRLRWVRSDRFVCYRELESASSSPTSCCSETTPRIGVPHLPYASRTKFLRK